MTHKKIETLKPAFEGEPEDFNGEDYRGDSVDSREGSREDSKEWYESKTIIFNILILLGILFSSIEAFNTESPEAFTAMFGDWTPIILIVITTGNMFLRILTKKKISTKPTTKK